MEIEQTHFPSKEPEEGQEIKDKGKVVGHYTEFEQPVKVELRWAIYVGPGLANDSEAQVMVRSDNDETVRGKIYYVDNPELANQWNTYDIGDFDIGDLVE